MKLRKIMLLLVLMFVISSVSAAGIGVGGEVFLKDVMRGGFATSRVYVTNPNDYPVTISIWLRGDTADWISTEPKPGFVIAPGETRYVDITITPPAFVPNGVYTGKITFVTAADSSATGGTGLSVSTGATLNAVIEISDQEIYSLKVSRLLAERTEECRPINLKVTLKNMGNVGLNPTYDVSLYHKQKGLVVTETSVKSELKPTLERTDTVSLSYETTNAQPVWRNFLCVPEGDYYATVSLKDQFGKEYYSERVDVFILPKGSLSASGTLKDVQHKEDATIGEPVKITAIFENTGDSTEQARLKVEVYKDEKLVEIVNGDNILADPGMDTEVTAYFIPKGIGEFNLHSSVNFGGRFTNVVQTSINVTLGLTVIALATVIPLAILIIVILLLLRKRRGY